MEERKQEGEIQAALPLCLAICFIFSLFVLQSPSTCKSFCSSRFKWIWPGGLNACKSKWKLQDGGRVCHLVQDFSILCNRHFTAHLWLELTSLKTVSWKMSECGALTFPSCPCFSTWFIIPAGGCAGSYSWTALCKVKTQTWTGPGSASKKPSVLWMCSHFQG